MDKLHALMLIGALMITELAAVHGLECYQTSKGDDSQEIVNERGEIIIPVHCKGSCYTFTSKSGSVSLGCYPVHYPTQCIKLDVGVSCFCNKSLCNNLTPRERNEMSDLLRNMQDAAEPLVK